MALIQTHEQARDQTHLITWKLGRPLQLLGEPVTVGLPRTQGQVPARGECILKLTRGFWESQWDPPSRTEGPRWPGCSNEKAHSPRETPAQKGKEGGAGIQLDNHLRPCLLTTCSGGMLFTRTPDVSETFPSRVYILNVLHSYWREGNKCPHSMQIYFSSNGGLTCDEVIPCETVLKKRVRD